MINIVLPIIAMILSIVSIVCFSVSVEGDLLLAVGVLINLFFFSYALAILLSTLYDYINSK